MQNQINNNIHTFNSLEQQQLKTLLLQVQSQVEKLVHYRNPSYALYPYYFVLHNKTFDDFYGHRGLGVFVLHLADNTKFCFFTCNLDGFSLNPSGGCLPLPVLEKTKATDGFGQLLPFYWFFFQTNDHLCGIFYFELPSAIRELSFFKYPYSKDLSSVKIACDLTQNYNQAVLDYELQQRILVRFATLDNFLDFFKQSSLSIQIVFLSSFVYEMSFSTWIKELCLLFKSLWNPVLVVGSSDVYRTKTYHTKYDELTKQELEILDSTFKTTAFYSPELSFEKEKKAFIYYALVDVNPKHIQNREQFSDYEFSLIVRDTLYSAHVETDHEGCFMSWYVKIMEFKFYYLFAYLDLTGDLINDAATIYNFLGQVVRYELPGVEMCGSFWNRKDKKLYFWLACYGQNSYMVLSQLWQYSYTGCRGVSDRGIVINYAFFSSISNSEWDLRLFVSKYMSFPNDGEEKAPLNLHYYVVCNPNNYVLIHIFAYKYCPNHYIDLLVDYDGVNYDLDYDDMDDYKDEHGNIMAVDYFVYNVLFSDREFDELGYGLGRQLAIWLLVPDRLFKSGPLSLGCKK